MIPDDVKANVEELISPLHNIINQCIRGALQTWKDVLSKSPDQSAVLGSRTRASFIHDNIVKSIQRELSEFPNVRMSTERGFLLVVVKETISMRFKKLNKRGRTSNIITKQQWDIYHNQVPLPDFPAGLRVSIGYELNNTETDIQSIKVVYEKFGVSIWEYKILATEDEAITQYTLPIEIPTENKRKPRVKAKSVKEQNQQDEILEQQSSQEMLEEQLLPIREKKK